MSAAQNVGTATRRSAPDDLAPSPHPIDPGQVASETHATSAGVEHLSSGAKSPPSPRAGTPRSTPDAAGQGRPETPTMHADGYLQLRAIAEVYEDIQRVRIAVENRVRHAPIDPALLEGRLDGLAGSEHQIRLLLRRTFRKVVEPEIVGWQAASTGIGEHILARLLGVIGHPIHTTVHRWEDGELVVKGTMERRVSDLWSYCGHGDPTRRPRKGMTQEEAFACGTPRAKMIVHQMAVYCTMQTGEPDKNGKPRPRSPYRDVYEFARDKYREREGWSDGHQHNAALRLVGKEILRDLWTAAR